MPLYVGVHKSVELPSVDAVVWAHRKGLEARGKHGVKYLKYRFNEDEGTVFCLIEAPNEGAGTAYIPRPMDWMPMK